MFWYNTNKTAPSAKQRGLIFLALILMASLYACQPEARNDAAKHAYFDIKGFFRLDSARLTQLNPTVNKTVTYSGATEQRQLHIGNWGAELSLFAGSDINRPAWRNSYAISEGDGLVIYTAKTPELKTRKVIIKQMGDTVKMVFIYNHTQNLLYNNYEELTYYPDSLYQIRKFQKIRLLGRKDYVVRGEFKQ